MLTCFPLLLFLLSDSRPDDPAALIDQVIAAEAANLKRQVNYLYIEQQTRRSFDRDRRLRETRTTTSEVIYIEGRPAFRLLSINGRPLTADEQRAETARLRQLAEDRRSSPYAPSPAEKRRRAHPLRVVRRLHDFRLSGSETMDGRDCWIVDSTPRRRQTASEEDERVTGSSIRYWIDKEYLHRVRMDVTSLKPSGPAKVHEVTSYRWGMRDGDVWLITGVRVVLPLTSGPVAYYEAEQLYSDYRRFSSESSLLGVEEISSPLPK